MESQSFVKHFLPSLRFSPTKSLLWMYSLVFSFISCAFVIHPTLVKFEITVEKRKMSFTVVLKNLLNYHCVANIDWKCYSGCLQCLFLFCCPHIMEFFHFVTQIFMVAVIVSLRYRNRSDFFDASSQTKALVEACKYWTQNGRLSVLSLHNQSVVRSTHFDTVLPQSFINAIHIVVKVQSQLVSTALLHHIS